MANRENSKSRRSPKEKRREYAEATLSLGGFGKDAVQRVVEVFPLHNRVAVARVLFCMLTHRDCPAGTLGWFYEKDQKISKLIEAGESLTDDAIGDLWGEFYSHLQKTMGEND